MVYWGVFGLYEISSFDSISLSKKSIWFMVGYYIKGFGGKYNNFFLEFFICLV